MTRGSFRRLDVWKRSKALAVAVYRLTGGTAFERDWALRDQLRRCAVGVPSNVAEGAERRGDRESAQFSEIAKGSLAELATQLEIALETGVLTDDQIAPLVTEAEELTKMLAALSSKLRRSP
ncbi:MAG: four helix bundle protein [Gammaproteobacteria bacterium]